MTYINWTADSDEDLRSLYGFLTAVVAFADAGGDVGDAADVEEVLGKSRAMAEEIKAEMDRRGIEP